MQRQNSRCWKHDCFDRIVRNISLAVLSAPKFAVSLESITELDSGVAIVQFSSVQFIELSYGLTVMLPLMGSMSRGLDAFRFRSNHT
jgi:hypothetical protein